MRRRLTAAILAAVAATLVLAGLGTLVLARFGTARAGEESLRGEVETAAALVKLGQARAGELDARQLSGVESLVCAARSGATERMRALLCAPEGAPLRAATDQLCAAKGYLRDVAVPAAMDGSRRDLCRAPGAATLDAVRRAWCGPLPVEVTAGRAPKAARLITFAVRAFCVAIGSPQPQSAAATALADEPVDLVTVDAGGAVTAGSLPAGVGVADLGVDALRRGDTVSGPVGRGWFAAAAVDPTAGVLQVVVAARPDDPTAGLVPWFLLASGVTLVLGVAVASSVSRSLVGPLQQATAVTAQIAAGDLDARLPGAGDGESGESGESGDEVARLSGSINAMAAALQASRAAERQFILAVSHDLRTPLTSIRGYAEAIADGAAEPDRAAQVILAESRRLERLVADLLQLGVLDTRQFTFHPVDVDLNDVAAESVDAVRRDVEQAGLALVHDPAPEPVPVRVDPDRLGQVLANLVENATKYAATRVAVTVALRGDRARIEVADDGPGIAEADLPHVLDRLFVGSSAPVRRPAGTGLGLAIAREMVQAMGGTIAVANGPAGGALVTVDLAVAPDPSAPRGAGGAG
jgi:signal transduction histidine kinase